MNIETLHIRNFAGLKDVRIELKPVTVLIGPQASGKSVSAKLVFFFKELVRRLPGHVIALRSNEDIQEEHRRLFVSYFPPESWASAQRFEVHYRCGPLTITVRGERSDRGPMVELEYSQPYDALLEFGRSAFAEAEDDPPSEDPGLFAYEKARFAVRDRIAMALSPALINESYFIPAGRSFFAAFRSSIFSLISASVEIDPFLVEFGRFYEQVRAQFVRAPVLWETLAPRLDPLLGGRYVGVKGDDFIRTPDGRTVPVAVASSGQQELLPLILALASVGGANALSGQRTVFVEEPEAHLFPSAQRQVVHLFAVALDLLSAESSSQYVITTHSPYILTALNNLMYGGKIAAESPAKREEVTALLGATVMIDPRSVGAYALENGTARSIIDPETQLVEASLIDRVSGELAREFEQLVAIEFGGDAD